MNASFPFDKDAHLFRSIVVLILCLNNEHSHPSFNFRLRMFCTIIVLMRFQTMVATVPFVVCLPRHAKYLADLGNRFPVFFDLPIPTETKLTGSCWGMIFRHILG